MYSEPGQKSKMKLFSPFQNLPKFLVISLNFPGKESKHLLLLKSWCKLRDTVYWKTRTEGPREDPRTQDTKEDPLSDDPKKDPINENPKMHPITEDP